MAKATTDADSDASTAGSGAGATDKLVTMLTNRLNEMQTDLKKTMDDIRSHSSGVDQTSQFGAISTKQDVGGDEAQSAGIALASGNERSLATFLGWQAARFADRDRVHFDNMQSLTALAISNSIFAVGLSQNLATVDAHQQCGRNADWRSATIASKRKE